MAIIIARRWRGTWEGVPVATWCSEWICRIGGGLVPHVIIIPSTLSLLPLRGAAIGRAQQYFQLTGCKWRASLWIPNQKKINGLNKGWERNENEWTRFSSIPILHFFQPLVWRFLDMCFRTSNWGRECAFPDHAGLVPMVRNCQVQGP